jgi:hypothetical protein
MRISVKYAIWLLALMPLAQGCDQKKPKAQTQTQTLAPPIIDIPPSQPSTVSKADLPPPIIGDTQPKPAADDAANKPPEPPKKPVHHPKKPATPAPATPSPTQEAASANPAPAVSAIGQLSGGASGDLRTTTEETINSTEKGVNGITRTLNDAEVKTAAQIHEFLKEAREALTTGDVDGAHTLANKAKVLLAELNQQ